jgi:hypothetical protein
MEMCICQHKKLNLVEKGGRQGIPITTSFSPHSSSYFKGIERFFKIKKLLSAILILEVGLVRKSYRAMNAWMHGCMNAWDHRIMQSCSHAVMQPCKIRITELLFKKLSNWA